MTDSPGPALAGVTYTAWPLPQVPDWMLATAPARAAWLVRREPDDTIGWIQAPCACPAADCTLAAQFVRLVAAAHGQVSLQPSTALVIYPENAVTVAFPRPGASDLAFRRECLGRHLISRVQLASTVAMWSGDPAGAEPYNLAATDLARQYGFIWRRLHGPVMLCRAAAGADPSWDLTARQLARLLTTPTTLPRDRQLAPAGVPGGQ